MPETPSPAPVLTVVTTGGTIASTRDEDGVSTPSLGPAELLAGAVRGARVRVVEALRADSSSLTLADAARVRAAVAGALADADVEAVVVLHGTDSMEETAYLLDLHHDDERAVVLTGAQRTADDPAPDGPGNVALAARTALEPAARGRGVLVAFGGRVHPAAGLSKRHTQDLDAFSSPSPPLPRAEPLPWRDAPWPRVDVVAVSPGDDGVLLDAARAAGARGVVLQALGSGNASGDVVEAVRRCTRAGVAVVVTTRVPGGPVSAGYGGGGGGHDLAAAGAVASGWLRAGQARVLLASLLRTGADADEVRERFGRRSGGALPH
ncbi:asparaginase [Paenibacillus sp. TRM 82003]|uniref:asparaginase n=1 Tax=Kineococcus sp. TRM81007 TaxID=2925831 RepID=UPI001F587745|nr:asparaginase [Kineococcus sp. TRM81007]MCI2239389.1 asparaginase [Kineococcus sp. TRM81007]MCI3925071.1 asparaginase [Paenibacillus sp. TRM 82003]